MPDTTIIEHRIFPSAELHVEQRGSKPPVITGYAAVFNSLSVVLWGFREKIAPGAFAKNLATNPDVRALFNHDPNLILGRTKSKTLQLWEDERGLRIENEPPRSPTGDNVLEAIRRGDIDQMSFGFRTIKDSWEYSKDGDEDVRTLLEVDLFDVSPVTFPAYPETSVGLRTELERITGRLANGLQVTDEQRRLLEGDNDALRRAFHVQQEQLRLMLDQARS
ncbi:MAG TPA: HK97 family phage prohead protease [Planctomycetota bacterium]|nr:HK97 family phage prohead protease [Planctomycetota bacterium]